MILSSPGEAYAAALESHARAVTYPRDVEDPACAAGNATDQGARELASTCPAFAPAFGASLRGYVVAPLTADGAEVHAGAEPTLDLATLLDVAPADGAVIEVDGRRWAAQWPLRPGTLHGWVAADVLGGKARAAA